MQPHPETWKINWLAGAVIGHNWACLAGRKLWRPLLVPIALALTIGMTGCSHQALKAKSRTDEAQIAAVRQRAAKSMGQLESQQVSDTQLPTNAAAGSRNELQAAAEKSIIDRSGYPAAAYLTAIGSGADRQQAAANAMAEIAKIFQSRIEASTSVAEEFRSTTGAGNESWQKTNIATRSKITTDLVISGIQIVQIVRQADGYLALAVLNRDQAAARLQRKLADLDKETEGLMANYNRQTDRLLKVRLLKKAQGLSVLRRGLASRILVLKPNARLASPPFSRHQIETELARILLQDFRLAVTISGQGAGSITDFMTAALTKRGFAVVNDTAGAQVVLEGKISITPQKQSRPGPWYYVNWATTFTLIDTANQVAIASRSDSGRKGHLSYEKAFKQALYHIGNRLVPRVVDEMSRHMFKLAENQ